MTAILKPLTGVKPQAGVEILELSRGTEQLGAARPERASEAQEPVMLAATPFKIIDEAAIPPRDWIYGRHFIRHFVSVTVAPGGVGKSSLLIAETLAMVTGRALLGEHVRKPVRVWLFNLEDPFDELQRRFAAAIRHYGISQDEIGGRLFVDSGRVQRLSIATQKRDGATIHRPIVDALKAEMQARHIDVLIVDPFISSHAVSENDNTAIDMVAKEWADIADKAGAAIELVHHTRKQSGDPEITTESSRGAKALPDAARSVRVVNRMSEAEAQKAGVTQNRSYFRVYADKGSMSPPADKSAWFKLENISLNNGDDVGVVVPWIWPDAMQGVTASDLQRVQEAIDGKQYRENSQASEWVGRAIADVLELDIASPADKQKIKHMVKVWVASGALRVVSITDEKGKERPVVEVGEWAI